MFNDAEALRIVYRGLETLEIECKRSIPWEGPARFKLMKIIAGLANAGGGYLVVGFDEKQQGDARFVGVDGEHLSTWDVTNVARDVNNHVEPDMDVEVARPQSRDSKLVFVVIRVPQHGDMPHICVKDRGDHNDTILRKGALYYRNRNKETTEIGRLDDWRDLIHRLTLARKAEIQELVFDALSSSGGTNLQAIVPSLDLGLETEEIEKHALSMRPEGLAALPLLIFAAIPSDSPVPQDIERSKSSLKSACVDYRGWPFLFYLETANCPPQFDEDSIWAVDTEPFYERPTFDYWRFQYTRSLFYSIKITQKSSVGLGSELEAYGQTKLIAEALIAMGRLYDGLGFSADKPIDVLLEYKNLTDARITTGSRHLLSHPYAGAKIILQDTIHLNELLARPWGRAAEIVAEVGQRMGVQERLPIRHMEGLAKKHLSGGQKLHH